MVASTLQAFTSCSMIRDTRARALKLCGRWSSRIAAIAPSISCSISRIQSSDT